MQIQLAFSFFEKKRALDKLSLHSYGKINKKEQQENFKRKAQKKHLQFKMLKSVNN